MVKLFDSQELVYATVLHVIVLTFSCHFTILPSFLLNNH